MNFWRCECVNRLTKTEFTARYAVWCKEYKYHFSGEKAAEVYALSQTCYSPLPSNDSVKLLITETARDLTGVSLTVETFRAELLRLASQLPEFPTVMKLYGAGVTTGPQLIAEIGDVTRFSGRKSLVAFAGIDPGDAQSGTYQAESVPISKRVASQLRRVLFVTVQTYLKRSPRDEPVYAFLHKKRSEGKPYYVYMAAAANKFLRIYYARVMEALASAE